MINDWLHVSPNSLARVISGGKITLDHLLVIIHDNIVPRLKPVQRSTLSLKEESLSKVDLMHYETCSA